MAGPCSLRHLLAGVASLIAVALAPILAQAQAPAELADRTELRVCADPSNLPFSNENGEGFENKIAELLAQHMKLTLAYTWYPQSVGFIVNTLRARECDLIMGIVAGAELVQNTNPYYRSAYVMVVRDEDKERLASFESPDMADARIGVIAGTPPSQLLLARNLMGHTVPYHLVVDTRAEQPGHDMLHDLADGSIDVALLWGPIAGYWIKHDRLPLSYTVLPSDPRHNVRMDFRITMAVREGEPEWKRLINEQIRQTEPQIRKVLQDFGVPLLDEQGRLITSAALEQPAVPEPAGYRTDNYRAPTPATVAGGKVLDTAGLRALIGRQHPVLVDVLAKQPKPKDRDPAQLWIEPKRDDIPGSVWLPNTGYGDLAPDSRQYLVAALEKLTGGDKAKPVVFYCDKGCWMSWNAAKRAATELGYTDVYWYPEGVQGWKEAGLDLEPAREFPMPGPTG